jgi:heme-degrading monooxygenase HmoA
MAFVSATRLRVGSIFYLPQFIVYALWSARQAQKSAGFLGGRLMRDTVGAFWTLTVWMDANAMDAYRTSGMHRAAMPKLLNWCDEASLAHWTQDSTDVPTWEEAYERMVNEGRSSKVNHPSPAQLARQIPAPRASRIATELRPL